jgi:membrane protease subunit HflK
MSNANNFGDDAKIPEIRLPKFSPRAVRAAVVVVLLALFALTSFYTVAPEETGLVLRFGRFDPYLYSFRVRNVDETLRGMSEAVMREIVGDRTVNEVLTVGRAEVALEVQVQLQEMCEQYETGIKIDQVVLQDVNPPDPVKPSFNEVNEAQQEKEKLINQAQSEYNKVVPRAAGEAQQTIQEAEGYAMDRVNRAQGDASRFTALYRAYRQAPDVTRKRIYLETMNQVLPQVERKVIVDDAVRGVLPLLNLDSGRQQGGK